MPSGRDLFVYTVEGGKAVHRKVETGLYRGGKAEILAGLQVGDLMVMAGQVKLRDGSDLKLPERMESPAAKATTEASAEAGNAESGQ